MKKKWFLVFFIFFSFSCQERKEENQLIKEKFVLLVEFISGKVEIKNEQKDPILLKKGDVVNPKDTIITSSNGLLVLSYSDEYQIIIHPNSIFFVSSLILEKEEKVSLFQLKKGIVFTRVFPKKNRKFYLETPQMFLGVRGTEFIVRAEPEKTILKVKEGKILAQRNIKEDLTEEENISINLSSEEQCVFLEKDNLLAKEKLAQNKLDLPKLTKEKLSKNDIDFMLFDRYFKEIVSENRKMGVLELKNTQNADIFINEQKIAKGDQTILLPEGNYFVRLEKNDAISENKITIKEEQHYILIPQWTVKPLKKLEPNRKTKMSF